MKLYGPVRPVIVSSEKIYETNCYMFCEVSGNINSSM